MPDTAPDPIKYPTGKFQKPEVISAEHISHWISVLDQFPDELRKTVEPLTKDQLNTPYRDGGWTIRQLVHHIPDSHMNGYIIFKKTLTEKESVFNGYDQHEWALLPDSYHTPVETSLALVKALHLRWTQLLSAMSKSDFAKSYFDNKKNRLVPLSERLGLYAWHCGHHHAHIKELVKSKGWSL